MEEKNRAFCTRHSKCCPILLNLLYTQKKETQLSYWTIYVLTEDSYPIRKHVAQLRRNNTHRSLKTPRQKATIGFDA